MAQGFQLCETRRGGEPHVGCRAGVLAVGSRAVVISAVARVLDGSEQYCILCCITVSRSQLPQPCRTALNLSQQGFHSNL